MSKTFLTIALIFSLSPALLAQDDRAAVRARRNEAKQAERRLRKQAEEDRKLAKALAKIDERELMNRPIRAVFPATPAQIKPLILRHMLNRGSNFVSDSESRLSFWERLEGGAGFGYALGASMAGRGTVRPELHIDFILIRLAPETEVRVLCAIAETSQRHGQTVSGDAGGCGRETPRLIEILKSIRTELSNPLQ
jgi:hypothetical protein